MFEKGSPASITLGIVATGIALVLLTLLACSIQDADAALSGASDPVTVAQLRQELQAEKETSAELAGALVQMMDACSPNWRDEPARPDEQYQERFGR
ncbi:MAG TPA: hypothetical protein VN838_05645 [Bradyrhizobium sp.]|nr:hypothetical protein [Bradyrhizobium sp.]